MVKMVNIQNNVAADENIINISATAVTKIKELMAEKGAMELSLRVFVAGGGCSGLQYGMAFEENIRDNDKVEEADGIKIVIDPVSLEYIEGANIDYVEGPAGGGFRVDNPNPVASSCGCGTSSHAESEPEGCGCSSKGDESCGCGH